jgi:hypothetical protein
MTPLVAAILGCRCNDYGLSNGVGAPDVPTDVIATSAGAGYACDLETPRAEAHGLEATCDIVDAIDPTFVAEWTYLLGDGAFTTVGGPPVILPVEGSPTIYSHNATTTLVGLNGRTGSTIGTARTAIQSETPLCTGSIFGAAWTAERFLDDEGQYFRVRDAGSLDEWAVSNADAMVHESSCSAGDFDADGAFEVVTVSGAWSLPDLHLLAQHTVTEFGTLYGSFARPHDVFGECNAVRAQADGMFFPMTGELVPWPAEAMPVHSFNGSPIMLGDQVAFWGTEADAWPWVFDTRILRLALDGSLLEASTFDAVDAPSIADVDGDNEPEMCVSGLNGELRVYETDGSIKWSAPSRGASPVGDTWAMASAMAPQCVLSDLDADGAYEAILMDQRGLRIFDGSTGTVLAEDQSFVLPGGRWWQSPVVADIDLDGSAEIVALGYPATPDETPDLYLIAYGAASGRWARTRPVWNEYAYDVSSVGSDGELVSWPIPPWRAYNTYRAQPSFDGHHPDLVPRFVDLCVTDGVCASYGTGDILLSLQVDNVGSREQPAGTLVRLFTRTDDACFREVASETLDEPIPAGTSSDAVVLSVPAEDWGTRQVVEAWYELPFNDPDRDCDVVNNRLPLYVEPCSDYWQ